MNDQERLWLTNADRWGGSFVAKFARACFAADDANFMLLRSVLGKLMEKYPMYSTTPGGAE